MLRWLITRKQLRIENDALIGEVRWLSAELDRSLQREADLVAQLEARDRDLERALADNKRLTLAALSRSMRVGQVVGRDPVTGRYWRGV